MHNTLTIPPSIHQSMNRCKIASVHLLQTCVNGNDIDLSMDRDKPQALLQLIGEKEKEEKTSFILLNKKH